MLDIIEKDKASIHSRIDEMVQVFANGNKSAFGRKAGLQSGVLAGLLGGRFNKPSFEVLQRLRIAYPQVREEWLLFGEGQMLKDEFSPHVLRLYVLTSKMHMETIVRTYKLEEVDNVLTLYKQAHERLVSVKPAFEALEGGAFPDFDRTDVQDYSEVVAHLAGEINALESMRAEFFKSASLQHMQEISRTTDGTIPNGFAEVTDNKGKKVLIAVNAISHIYSASPESSGTVIELLTLSDNRNTILDTRLSYEDVKALILLAS